MAVKHAKRNGWPDQVSRLVIKIGSRVLVDERGMPDQDKIKKLVSEIASLHQSGMEVVVVSSGAIAAGVQALGWEKRPANLPDSQMAAAVGQSVLMQHYTEQFALHNCIVGQVLLTHSDLNERERHLNARNTLLSMLRHRVIPIINENDVVAVEEIRFGDNDVLASMASTLIDADLLLLLTTADGLCRMENGVMKERIPVVEKITAEIMAMAQGKGSNWSSGGMASKLQAAENAVKGGTPVVIANGLHSESITGVLSGDDIGTFIPVNSSMGRLNARKKWIAFFHRPRGSVIVDAGAADAICKRGNSLLSVGIDRIEGRFDVGELVNIRDLAGHIFARGITAYSREDLEMIKGHKTDEIPQILGENYYEEVIHRDNMVIL